MTSTSPVLRPIPRRNFDLTASSTTSSSPKTPSPTSERIDYPQSGQGTPKFNRTRSILNLTSSTLFGIYAPSEDLSTPWGNGAQTPAWRGSLDDNRPPVIGAYITPALLKSHPRNQFVVRDTFISLLLRTCLLFILGIAYGVIIIHLHDDHRLAPVKVAGIERYSSWYLLTWGVAGVLLGNLLPWVDTFWEEIATEDQDSYMNAKDEKDHLGPSGPGANEDEGHPPRSEGGDGADWTLVIRSIGAFIGIALAIRRLPWESTLQASLTLALVNPVLWYSVDRSKPGFVLSTIIGIAGTAIALLINPNMVPSPAPNAVGGLHRSAGLISNESIAVSTWIASVLFCSSVCFGNIGRMLSLGHQERRTSTP